MKDFTFESHGSVCILTPISESAKAWAEACIADDGVMWGDGYVVEPRYAAGLLGSIEEEGFEVGAA